MAREADAEVGLRVSAVSARLPRHQFTSAPNTMTSLGFSPHLDKEQLAERTVDMVLRGIRA